MAASAGGYSGIAGILGMPVDFGLNVMDLAKAGVGYTQSKITGEPPSGIFDPVDRPNFIGSSDYLKRQMNRAGVVTEAPRPDDRASRWIKGLSEFGTGVYLGSQLPGQGPRLPPRPAATSASPAAAARANANVNVGAGQAGAQSTASGALNASVRGGGYNFGTVADDAANSLSAGQRAAAEAFPQGRLTPGQATGNKLLQRLEAKLESQPMTAGPFDRIKDANIREINRAVSRAIGENTDNLSPAVLDRAATRIGGVFDDVADDATRTIDPREFLQRFSQIQDDVRGLVRGFSSHELVEDLTRLATRGQATGQQLQSLTSKLGRAAYKNMSSPNGDRDLGMALYRVKDYVDDLLQQGMSAERQQAFQQAREQYRNLMLLTSRVGSINPSTGNVNGSLLANLLQQKDKSGFMFGRNTSDMYNAARFAQAFRPIVGDSGTATRMPLPTPTDFLISLPFNLATRAYTSSPSVNAALSAQAAAQGAGNVLRMPNVPASGLLGGALLTEEQF
jgi:hypothetical protein